MTAEIKENSLEQNRNEALKLLFDTVQALDAHGVVYHLEGGTLLGVVRDEDLLPWDHDVDISILSKDRLVAEKALKKLFYKGYRVTSRYFLKEKFAFEKGGLRILKVKKYKAYFYRNFVSIFKNKNLKPITMDVFVKYSENGKTYWQASSKVMSVPSHHYASYEEIEFMGVKLKVPNNVEDYLTLKYGDWKVPIREWKCSKDEGTIVDDI